MIVAKPSTYMNESGGPVAGLLKFFSLTPARLIVVHDELDIPFGEVRMKWGGGEGGHHGLRSFRALITQEVVNNDRGSRHAALPGPHLGELGATTR